MIGEKAQQEQISPLRRQHPTRSTPDALRQTLLTLLVVIGSALPFAIAFFLVASTNEDNPLDNIPDYEDPLTETLSVPLNGTEPVTTVYQYQRRVRLFIEGTGQIGEAAVDAFYHYADGGLLPDAPPIPVYGLEINGQPALDALKLAENPPAYEADHLYPVIYDAGIDLRPMTIRFAAGLPGEPTGALTITVVQLID